MREAWKSVTAKLKRLGRRDFWTREIHQSWFVVWLCVGVVAGTIVGIIFRVKFFASGWFVVLSGFLFMICLLRPLLICGVLALSAGFWLSFARVAVELTGEDYVRRLYGSSVVVTGEVDGDAETDGSETKMKLADLKFGEGCGETSADAVCHAVQGSLYVTVARNEQLGRGDKVTLAGKMAEGFGTYAGYMYKPRIVWWARPDPQPWILAVRDWFAERIVRTVGGTEAKLGLSYLMGMKSGLPSELEESLRTVGLTHIVVASGAHLAILVGIARKVFGRLSRFAGLLFSGMFIVIFMALVGWTPSILRAGIMALLTLIGWYVGRKIKPWRMILMVAAGTLLMNPMFVINLGWLLSFASYAGITIAMPKLAEFFYGEKKPGFVGGMVLTTISATVMTLPIILYFYGQVSLISVVANLLILPTLSLAMGVTFLAGVVAGVPLVEVAVAWVARTILAFHILVVETFGEWVQFLVKIEAYQSGVFALYLVILAVGGIVWVRERKRKAKTGDFTFDAKSGKIKVSK